MTIGDIGPKNQIPPGMPLKIAYDVLIDTEQIQQGLARIQNVTINRHIDVVYLAQIINGITNEVLHEDTQFAHVNPMGHELGNTDGKIFEFDVSSLPVGQYSIVTFAWPKVSKEQRVSSIPHNFIIGDPF